MQTPHPYVSRVVTLAASLCDRADAHVDDPSTPYDSFSKLVDVAIRNQLELDIGASASISELTADVQQQGSPSTAVGGNGPWSELLHLPDAGATELAPPVPPSEMDAVYFLTNRLNPIPVVVRVLANMGPTAPGAAARAMEPVMRFIGLKLKAGDAEGRGGVGRRLATSWPVGEEARKSAEKFRASYLMDNMGRGALRDLGLSQVVNGSILLTKDGLGLSRTPSPILRESSDGTVVGSLGRKILCRALLVNPAERAILATFFGAFDDRSATQEALDSALIAAYGWNKALAGSHRSALIGRLRDLELLDLEGRGPSGTARLTEAGRVFMDRALDQALITENSE